MPNQCNGGCQSLPGRQLIQGTLYNVIRLLKHRKTGWSPFWSRLRESWLADCQTKSRDERFSLISRYFHRFSIISGWISLQVTVNSKYTPFCFNLRSVQRDKRLVQFHSNRALTRIKRYTACRFHSKIETDLEAIERDPETLGHLWSNRKGLVLLDSITFIPTS